MICTMFTMIKLSESLLITKINNITIHPYTAITNDILKEKLCAN